MKNTDSYNVYYREKGAKDYTLAVNKLKTNTYKITSLKDNVTYEVYVTGNNKKGEGKASVVSSATTLVIQPAQLPKYKMINTSNGEGELTSHIKNVTYGYNTAIQVVGSALDEGKENSALALVDDDYNSYVQINDWDYGVTYHPEWRFRFEFDQVYQMNYVSFAGPANDSQIFNVAITYIDNEGNEVSAKIDTFKRLTDENGRHYFIARLQEPIETSQLRFGIQSYVRTIQLSEFHFHYYDSLEGDVNDLFTDSYHLSLRDDVNETTINELQTRLDTTDTVSKEYHPFKEMIQSEINQAKQVLEGTALQDVQEIHNEISVNKQKNLGISGLNSWQPLGYVANADENLTLYVGQAGKHNGDSVNLQLVYSQYHGESSAFVSQPIQLKVGKNEINLREIQTIDAEKGGSIYVQYTGNSDEKIAVRVSGGHEIATLDLYHVSDNDQRLRLVKDYIEALQTQMNQVQTNHSQYHTGQYDEKNCTLGATEIMLDHMLYSVSGQQILNGLTGSTIDEKAKQLLKSLDAMDQMMELFYQNKGLNANAKDEINQYPAQHLNIRYQRMFAGAFMYAGGNHIGIEWDEVKGLTGGVPFTAKDNGQYVSGSSFGWGIAHEIGHNINQSSYAIAEITNNFFSLLSQNQDSNATTRFKYSDVYTKVTSGVEGRDSNVFTQLAMYWQLHLAYDQNYHYKLYDSYDEQFKALFYARVDSYARNPESFETPNGVDLQLNSTAEQNFVRLACAAANKDLTDFFTAWGITPNKETKAFISQFDKETRALQYLDDDSFSYRLEGQASMSDNTTVKATLQNAKNSNQVTLTITNTNSVDNAMLGYEILRNGKVVGFVNAQTGETTFTDTVSTLNNRVITYSVVGYDRLLNKTEAYTLSPMKISHDGSLDKQNWTIETNMTSDSDASTGSESETPCTPTQKAITSLIDNNYQNTYTGQSSSGNSEIIVSLNTLADITGVKLRNPSFSKVKIYVSDDKENWTLVKEDSVEKNKENILYFSQIVNDELQNNKSLVSYSSGYVKIVVEENEVSLSEIDVLGPTGDNIELETNGIGILSHDYQLDDDNTIPKGSLVFTGTYSGNPAYNVVELKDENNQIISGYQAIFAEDPGENDLADVSEGTWVYYLVPEKDAQDHIVENSFGYYDENDKFVKVSLPSQVKAELYRVNDAQTNEGQRLASDSFDVSLPSTIPSISLNSQKKGGQ